MKNYRLLEGDNLLNKQIKVMSKHKLRNKYILEKFRKIKNHLL